MGQRTRQSGRTRAAIREVSWADELGEGYRSPALERLDDGAGQRSPARSFTEPRSSVLEALEARLASLETRLATVESAELSSLDARLALLEDRPAAAEPIELAELAARLAQLEQRQQWLADNLGQANQAFRRLVERLGELAARVESSEARQPAE